MSRLIEEMPKPGEEDRTWFILSRWQGLDAEQWANTVRLVSIASFYAIELINFYGLNLGIIEFPRIRDRDFHLAVSCAAAAWVFAAFGIEICLRARRFPEWMPYATTAFDALMVSLVLAIAGGPRSPLVAAYFLVQTMALLRLEGRLIAFATVATIAGYLGVVVDLERSAATQELSVPRYQQLMVTTTLLLCGMVEYRVVKRVRILARDYALRFLSEPLRQGVDHD